jgi:hypothetical protein
MDAVLSKELIGLVRKLRGKASSETTLVRRKAKTDGYEDTHSAEWGRAEAYRDAAQMLDDLVKDRSF